MHPARRGEGLGWRLAEARHQLARDLGVSFFLGMTWATNTPMLRIFARQGLRQHAVIPRAYRHHDPPDDGLMYVGGLR